MIWRKPTATEISVVEKKSPPSSACQGTFCSANARMRAGRRVRTDRQRITMSPVFTGRRPSPSVTGKPLSSSSRIRRARNRASA